MVDRNRSWFLAVLCILAACCQSVLFADTYEIVFVDVGEEFTVALALNPSTGYQWILAESQPSWLELVDRSYVATNPELIGGGGTEYWTFRATAAGSTTLTFEYMPPSMAAPERVHVVQVTAEAPADTEHVDVLVGEQFAIRLESNPSTGYQWVLAGSLPPWLELLGTEYTPTNPGVIGGGGVEEWTFRATGTGSATVMFEYMRSWEGMPIQTHIVVVTARPASDRSIYVRTADASGPDPAEDGSFRHPYDTVQEAINAASDGAIIEVLPGTYPETIDLGGKNVTLQRADLADAKYLTMDINRDGVVDARDQQMLADMQLEPAILDGQGAGPVVTFSGGEDADCVLSYFTITGGYAEAGGGILCNRSSPTITHCLIVGNRAFEYGGGGIDCYRSDAKIVSCTIAGNDAPIGGGISAYRSHLQLSNCIVWGNTPDQIDAESTASVAVTYSDVAGGWTGTGNKKEDPLFAWQGYWKRDAAHPDGVWVAGDYHLMSKTGRRDPLTRRWKQDTKTSPCINAGDPADDVGSEPTPNGGRINMGAYGGTAEASKS
ncbi:MAG: protease inhibitor I42 family protein [Sedimentisphaerales bacterium]|nr:protease inhibitor I42 family protein [Sedimentisphaerales bacterium]